MAKNIEIVEISVISQKFLHQYIHEKIPNIKFNDGFPLESELDILGISLTLRPLIPNNRRHGININKTSVNELIFNVILLLQ